MQQKIRDYIIPENYDIFKSWRPEQHFQRLDKYSNYLWEEFRLETWEEVIARATDTLRWISKDKIDFPHYQKIFDLMYRLEVMPSMRLLSMSQAAIERCNTVLYNCTAGLGDTLTSIAEAQYLSMSGSGVTWSVERQNVNKIPAIKPKTGMMFYHRVKDTQIGWAESTKLLLNELAHGNDVTMNYEEIRPYGAPLKTKGGYASGPEILIKTHDFIRETFKNAQGRKLRPIEMHDMFCFALESGVSGGVRRCLSEDTEVITSNGLMKIKDIIPGDLAWTPEGYKKITNVFEQGKQAVTKITLSNGTTVEATENHRLAVVTKNGYEWRYVSEISLSDKLLLNGVEAKSGKNIEINIDVPGEHSHATTKLTKDYFTIDEDFAWMFGKFLADGCVMHRVKNGVDFKRGISIATHTNEEVQREKLYNFFSSFGVNVANVEAKGENCFHTNIVNGQIGRTFGDFKTAKTDIRIPHFIKESPASVRAAFLAGLADGDGCLHTKNIVLVHTIYDALRDDVINLYASLGIVAHSKTTIRKNGWKNIHKVSVKGLSNKKNLVALLSPFTTKKIYDFKLNMYDYNANGVLLSNMPDKRLVPVEISSIEREYKIVETFDIEVEEVHCFFANGVLSHNSAGMCIFDADETDILTCKYDGFWNHPIHKVRANANNSAVWGDNLSKSDIEGLTEQMFTTGVGEPGAFKRSNAINTSPSWREFLHPESVTTNPCLVAGTMVQTKQGHFAIETLVGKDVEIWDGLRWTSVNNFRVTGENQPVTTLTLHDGTEITATPYHKFILEDGTRKELKDLEIGDRLQISSAPQSHGLKRIKGAYLKGFLMGDDTLSNSSPVLHLYEQKYGCEDRLIISAHEIPIENTYFNTNEICEFSSIHTISKINYKHMRGLTARRQALLPYFNRVNGIPKEIFESDYKSKCEFIAGLFDADGCASDSKSGFWYQFSSIYKNIILDVQLLLKTIGVQSTLSVFGENSPNRYSKKICYKLGINQQNSIILAKQLKFSRLQSFEQKTIKREIPPKWNKITKIEDAGVADTVYCCTVYGQHQFSLTNGVQTAQCGEIYLQPIPIDSEYIKGGGWQFCNLSSINVRHDDTIQALMEKTYYATIIGDIQSLATEFEFLRSGTKTICDKDRLLGVNLVGHATAPIIRNNERLVKELQAVTVETDLIFAKQFNVNRSAALGSVKPSGNHSVLCYTAPGGNPIHSIYQIRNVTVNKNSAMHLFLESQGVPFKDYPGRDYASMFAFPIEYPEDSLTLDNTGAIAQLENWKYLKVNWCHHNPSVSVTYVPEEKEEIIDWLYQNQDIIGGLAFFPKYESSYELLPIVSVSKERYDEFTKDYPTISWEYYRLYETAVDDRQQVAECVGGQCVIV